MNPIFLVIAVSGGLILSLSTGVRQTFGLLQEPLVLAHDWSRSEFAFAIALQNLVWGLLMPLTGALADRFGTLRILFAGGILYTIGVILMGYADTPGEFALTAGVLVGMGTAATGIPLVLAVVGRSVGEKHRSLALGVVAAGGSFGQFVLPPYVQLLMNSFDWSGGILGMAVTCLLFLPMAFILSRAAGPAASAGPGQAHQSLREALAEASSHSGYRLLTLGFFVCGFHVAFVTTHLPSYLISCGLSPMAGAAAIAGLGLFNIIGTLLAGALGGHFSKKYLLSGIYALRALVILVFLLLPVNEWTVFGFSALFGMLWLSTVPLTSGIVSQVFGPRYVATLFGIVMMSHQVGAFVGVWLGGYLYDVTGGYQGSWIAMIGMGVFAAIVHLPIRETPIRQPA